jgi:hypothetical protein
MFLDKGEAAKTVVFQLEQEVVRVEGFGTAGSGMGRRFRRSTGKL